MHFPGLEAVRANGRAKSVGWLERGQGRGVKARASSRTPERLRPRWGRVERGVVPIAVRLCSVTPRRYRAPRIDLPNVVDGRLGKPFWQKAQWSEAFVDIEGDLRPAPVLRTQVKMAWNECGLWILADLEEPHLWATLTEHDSVIFQDNDFEVFIDPDGDALMYGELEINALNTTWDLLLPKPYRDGGPPIDSWEIKGLETAVDLRGTLNDPRDTDDGWSVEILMPWRSVREISRVPVPPRPGDVWRINFSRVQWDLEVVDGRYQKIPDRPEHNWVWSPQGVIDMHQPERWGFLEFGD